MSEALAQQASEWFQRGDHDIETAQLLYDAYGHTDAVAYHIQQTIEKYLKGYLILNGQKPPRTHDLGALLNLASRFQPDLYTSFIELCEKVTRYYVEDHYPPGPPAAYDRNEIKADLDLAWQLIKLIRQSV